MIEVRALLPTDELALVDFFTVLKSDSEALRFFHPHPFDASAARRIATREAIRTDCYFGAFEHTAIVGYGMLRGWDEGYDVPAFGVCVAPAARGRGVASALLQWGIAYARAEGSEKMMLKVYPQNVAAVRMYERVGFELSPCPQEPTQMVGYLDLRPSVTL